MPTIYLNLFNSTQQWLCFSQTNPVLLCLNWFLCVVCFWGNMNKSLLNFVLDYIWYICMLICILNTYTSDFTYHSVSFYHSCNFRALTSPNMSVFNRGCWHLQTGQSCFFSSKLHPFYFSPFSFPLSLLYHTGCDLKYNVVE